MPKSFMDAFKEWVKEDYEIGEDIGAELVETEGPTPSKRSSTTLDNGTAHSAQAVLNSREKA